MLGWRAPARDRDKSRMAPGGSETGADDLADPAGFHVRSA